MAAPSCARSPHGALKRIKISSALTPRRWASTSISQEMWTTDHGIDIREVAEKRGIKLPQKKPSLSFDEQAALPTVRTPRNLTALRLRPLRRAAKYGVPVCDLQLRTYSVANMELFADFAMRAAYYLGLPAKGPVPLPRITERWTVPRSNFIFKKSQENFERITMRRLIQIQDGHPETVRLWLGVLQKYQYHGVGMKANVWEWESMSAASERDAAVVKAKTDLDKVWKGFGTRKESVLSQRVQDILASPEYGGALEVAKREDEKQRAKMDAADEARKLAEQEIEQEEFDKSFLMAYGPEALKAGRYSEKPPHTLRGEEEMKKEVERMNRILAGLDNLSESELNRLREKWALREEEEEEDDYSIRSFEKILEAMGRQDAEKGPDDAGMAEAKPNDNVQRRASKFTKSIENSKDE